MKIKGTNGKRQLCGDVSYLALPEADFYLFFYALFFELGSQIWFWGCPAKALMCTFVTQDQGDGKPPPLVFLVEDIANHESPAGE